MPPGRLLTSLLQAGDVHAALAAFYSHTPPAVSHLNDIVAVSAKGTHVHTAGGDSFLDFTSGIGVVSTGHCHPRIVSAVQAQAAKLVHAQQNIFGAHEPGVHLIDRLLQIMPSVNHPGNMLNKFFFTNSGSEAVDNAIKVARGHTGKPNIIAFEGGFHGRTYGAMACTSSKTIYRQGFGPVMPGVFIAPYPACLHCKASGDQEYPLPPDTQHTMIKPRTCCNGPLEAVQWMLKMQTAPQETAAIIVEPILGEGGIYTPPPGFLMGLRKLCDKHGMLLILDEVQAGAGRTGVWWSHALYDKPEADIMVFAKGIASGYPVAGIAAKPSVFEGLAPGTLGGTYGGNAVCLAAATATIDTIIEEGLLENAKQRGNQLMQGLVDIASRQKSIIDVRGRGLMVGVELGHPLAGLDGLPPPGLAAAVVRSAAKQNVLLMTAGPREIVRFLPPLTVSPNEVDEALSAFDAALAHAIEGRH